jgi:uncharacterized protein YfaS (alpha-2-macroglobulin family)
MEYKEMVRFNRLISLVLVLSLTCGSFLQLSVNALGASERNLKGVVTTASNDVAKDVQKGLRFRLSQGIDQPESRPASNLAPTTSLSENETENVLKRLPAIKIEASDEQEFALRDRSLPPPRTGKIINVAFPPAENISSPETKEAGPLEVLRYAPEGDVPLAPQLSVTFSQPMIAVSSQEEAATNVPVKLSPQPPGKWRWVGTKTLLFEPAGRFPMATRYSVTVPAGTRSANGGTLATSKTWDFTTPPPTAKNTYPAGDSTQPRDALMFVEFDQRIDPSSVLKTIKLRAGRVEIKTRLATRAEIESDDDVRKLSAAAQKDRWLAFRAVGSGGNDTKFALPANAKVSVSIGPGTPSAEGPRPTTNAQGFSFRTFGPLRVTKHECGYGEGCTPFDSWEVAFSNSLDEDSFKPSQIHISPETKGLKTSINDDTLAIEGLKQGRTVYTVTLDASIKDRFGQTLGRSAPITFNVGSAPPSLTSAAGNLAVLDPAAPPRFSVYSVNQSSLRLQLYAVEPEQWGQYLEYLSNDATNKRTTPPGKLVLTKSLTIKNRPDEMIETEIDLSPGLGDGHGQLVVIVEPGTRRRKDDRESVQAWVQVTDIGLDAFVDRTDLIGWATSLKDGTPLSNVQVTVTPYGVSATTGADGIARVALAPQLSPRGNVLVARRGSDVAILPEQTNYWATNGLWFKREAGDVLRWYVFDDRKMYRPGEEVHVKGWIRRVGGDKRGDVGPPGDAATVTDVVYTLRDSSGNEITKAGTRLNALGGFDITLKLPATMNLGFANLELLTNSSLAGATFSHNFQVQEFRRPEFEVTAKNDSDGPYLVGGNANVSVSANYYAGGGLPSAKVMWRVTSTPGQFTPPNRGDYTFGKWIPWWIESREQSESHTETFTATTDAGGKHRLHIDFDSVNPPRPSSVTAEARVTDVNRQTWASTTTMLVHPADLYVGLKSEKTFVQQGEPLVVQSIVTDLDGKAIPNREIKMRAVLLDWQQDKGEWKQVETKPQECSIQSSADAVKCTFQSSEGGQYRVTATIRDDRERRNESELTLWVAGGKQPPKRDVEQEKVELIPDRKEYRAGEAAEILVQAPFFPAEGVLTLRRSGILKSERFRMDGPTYTLRVPIEAAWTPNVHVQVDLVGAAPGSADILSASSPNSQATTMENSVRAGALNADRMSALPGALPAKRPAFASGELNLSIPPIDRKLTVTATPRDKAIEPGGETSVSVEVTDAAGKLVSGSEVAVVVVDESVLALTNYKLDDPISIFYAQRSAEATDYHSRANVLLGNPGRTVEEREQFIEGFWRVGGGGAGGGRAMASIALMAPGTYNDATFGSIKFKGQGLSNRVSVVTRSGTSESSEEAQQIRLRENFNALAVFAPSVRTDANGRAQVQVKLPDNLTRYRVMSVAVAGGKQFGSGESTITARMPLMVRPSAPRFLNFGDRFELPIVVQNQTDQPMTVDVAVRATNVLLSEPPAVAGGLSLGEPSISTINRPLPQAVLTGRRVVVPANDRVEVRIPVAAVKPGTARFQIGVVSGRWSDAAEVSLPVWTPATTEAFATYGEIDDGAIAQPVKPPANVFKQFGGLEIETSSTQLQQLTDAFLYLQNYPYECSEQLASRIISVAALRDVLTAFKAKDLPSPQEIEAAVTRDLKRLQGLQNDDGGFGFWKRGDESWPYLSLHVAHALARAKRKDFDVPAQMLVKSQNYLRAIESHIPSRYGADTRRALIAYALYVRAQMGDRDTARARKLIAESGLENLSLESVGWLLSVLTGDAASQTQVTAIRRLLSNRATETAATAHFACSYSDGDYLLLNSDRRADGVILEALIADQPNNDLILKIVRGLLDHRTRGRWGNTQENVFILLALDRYFNTYERVTPDFVARVWLGAAYAGEQQFKGRSVDRQQVNVPMRYLAEQGATQNLIVSKEGGGRLYYRIGMNYAPSDLNLKPADYGFTVERTYEAVDDPADVQHLADGTWRIKAGARVRVRLTMVAAARRYHVALVDPLPAGFESLNPALAVTESIPEDKQQEAVVTYGSRSFGFGWWLWRPVWFDHQNLRDERAEAFTSLLWEGVYTYSYVARATTPGDFVVPPAKAEEMYHPETFGRGRTDRVRID